MVLEELKQLQMGDNVVVTLNSGEELEGFLRYKGPISSQEPATIFGVELIHHPGRCLGVQDLLTQHSRDDLGGIGRGWVLQGRSYYNTCRG